MRAGLVLYATMVLGEMTKELRVKVKTLITIDVHGRDIVLRLVNQKCDTPTVFQWASQLKFRWPEQEEEAQDLYINICDAQFTSSHEYVGNPGRLVITALTDRCYITLTQALRLMMGGAPQGPAGTGKTETTKDLGRGLSIWVIVSIWVMLRPDEQQGDWPILLGPRADGRVGLLRRVQPHHRRGALGRCGPVRLDP